MSDAALVQYFFMFGYSDLFFYTPAKISLAFGFKNVKILQLSASKIDKNINFYCGKVCKLINFPYKK